jgi:hypothetical protein
METYMQTLCMSLQPKWKPNTTCIDNFLEKQIQHLIKTEKVKINYICERLLEGMKMDLIGTDNGLHIS